jgi:uncharacterized protein YbbC (DUF1343 family)
MAHVIPGIENLLKNHVHLVAGRKIGLITNPAAVDRARRPLLDIFLSHPQIQLQSLFGPEHGVRGDAEAGEPVPFSIDKDTGIPVYSLYGQVQGGKRLNRDSLDEMMRDFDTRDEGKFPAAEMMKDLDVMVFDLQDVGTRVYTYIATMAYCMQMSARLQVPFVILDRPNPINGSNMEGPILDYPEFSSFVGLYPIPLRHGMTVGELALMFNDRFLVTKADLTVIPMQGWKRNMWFDETGLPWILPSPNLPTLDSVTVYPGQVFWEGTNVSEGRGTALPFEQCGAPWIDAGLAAERLNRLELSGVRFEEARFRPAFSKYNGRICGGVRLNVTDRTGYQPLMVTLHMLKTVLYLYSDELEFHEDYFDKIMGTDKVRRALCQGKEVGEITSGFVDLLQEFAELRKPYLLYTD